MFACKKDNCKCCSYWKSKVEWHRGELAAKLASLDMLSKVIPEQEKVIYHIDINTEQLETLSLCKPAMWESNIKAG